MRKRIFFTLFSVLLFGGVSTNAQIKSIGLPSIVNHSKSVYNASTQNWSITQNSKGFVYFGNNDGVLEYDGTGWKIYPVPNASVVRSVLAVGDTIYTGAFEEIGFLAPNAEGKLQYNSLKSLIPKEFTNFDEIWNIYKMHDGIIFQSYNYIFRYSSGTFKVIKPISKFSMFHNVNDLFYVVDVDNGFMQLVGDSLVTISDNPIFFRNELRCVLQLDGRNLLIGTSNEGLFLFDRISKAIKPWQSDVNDKLRDNNLFSALNLSTGDLAFGSVSNGIYISNIKGEILQHLNRYRGLQNNTVLSLFEDKRNNLWLGLDNGIDYLEVSSPLTFLNYNFNIESAYSSIVHNGILYVGTNQGLYAKALSKFSNNNLTKDGFELIKGTDGQVWTLEVIDNTLFCGHNYGCFTINGMSANQISDRRGFWTFQKLPNESNKVLAGTYNGLVTLHNSNGQWQNAQQIAGYGESSRSLFLDQDQSLWVSHGYRGLFKLKLSSSLDSVVDIKLYRSNAGLPSELPYNIQTINSTMYVTTRTGIYTYDSSSDTFRVANGIGKILESKGFIDKLHQDINGNLWYFTDTYLGLMRLLEDGNYIDITAPFSDINDILLPAFQNIYTYDPQNVFIGSQKGLIHYSSNIIKDYKDPEEVFITETTFYGKQNVSESHHTITKNGYEPNEIPYGSNSVTFRFTSPSFERPEKTMFSYRLIGFDSRWSTWDAMNFKEYTNLREGNYTFQVKAKNSFGTETNIKSFHFTVKPPFLRSKGAYITYSIILTLVLLGNFYYIRKRILKTRLREKLRHEKRLAQREKMFKEQTALSEKEIMHLRNESLRNEMKFKNKELANATLHLIQKNKTLTYLREDLTRLIKNIPSDSPEKQNVNNLLKKINKDLKNEKGWELFNSYFDEVHQDFIGRLKDRYPDLTPKELRLCAYLKMNISTKEIAPLMNISVRGVEISRYRLRKKLQLDHNANLTEFLISF
jgi:ligand-binding sensor domain-containing protein/DNA-binding CsgD family transcriptional regulator